MPQILITERGRGPGGFFYTADVAFHIVRDHTLDFPDMADVGGMPLLAVVFTLVILCALPLVNGVSRYLEYQADQYALRLTGLVGVVHFRHGTSGRVKFE